MSPVMHNAAFKQLGLDYEYVPMEVEPKDLKEAIGGLKALHIAGFNVTIPYKQAVIPLIDKCTELAETIGAVNTVQNQDGTLIGYNTDAEGFIDSLKLEARFLPKGKNVVIIGSGGASRAVCTMLAREGVKSLTITDVLPQKALDLSEYLKDNFSVSSRALDNSDPILQREINHANLVVNTSPIGMEPKTDACPISDDIELHPGLTVYDLVYNPKETKLLKKAKQVGANAVSGLGMLVRQGALAFELWTGQQAPLETMREAAEAALKQ